MRAEAGELSPLTPDAAAAAAALARACGWGHEAADWRARRAAGRGFAIRDGARLVGAVGLHDAGPGLFMGMLLTDPGARGRGIGSALTRACRAAAKAAGKPLGLFATALGRPIYERMGFEA
ncbi:MAG: GNAT family N-acetyltransferase, partial [Pseudomonadota bacterium]|nr:GNAT family N-acetyltransferase [Pseudomonadota bacterium]